MLNLEIQDVEHGTPTAVIRYAFERVIKDTPKFVSRISLDIVRVDGNFSRYRDPETQVMWIGFAIGMRCRDRFDHALLAELN